jgi:probable HAF family extracellular repeat protein
MVLLKWKSCITAIALTAISLTASKSALAASLYSVTDLGALTGEANSFAYDINDSGEVIINSSGGSGSFLYSNGSLQKISPLSGYNSLAVLAINNLGQVLGNSGFDNNVFIYTAGTTQSIGINGIAYDINDSGEVVGGTTGGGTFPKLAFPYGAAFLYSNGQTTIINKNLEENYVAYGVNNLGQVVGIFGSPSRAFLYDKGIITNLGVLPGDDENYSSAQDINDSGRVVGVSGLTGVSDGRAFLYSSSTGLQNLGRLRSTDLFSGGVGINNLGQVVGYSGTFNDLKAFIYSDNTLYDLNDLIAPGLDTGFTLRAASAINNNGQIVGYGTVNGESHAFLLTPVSSVSVAEPTSGVPILSFGAVLILFVGLKRKPNFSSAAIEQTS